VNIVDLALRVQDIIGLILAVLIVAILISIVLILRESARERRMWEESEEEDIFSPPRKRSTKKPLSEDSAASEEPTSVAGWKGKILKELEARKAWNALSRSAGRKSEAPKEEKPPETVFQPLQEEEVSIPLEQEKLQEEKQPQIPLEEPIEKSEPPQVVLERALKKLQGLGLDIKEAQPLLDEESIVFSPLLWEVKEEIRSGKEMGNIVVHTVFKTMPGYSGEEVVEMYRSGNLSVVEKMEARIRTAEGREFLVATLGLEYFRVPVLEKTFYEGHLSEKEYELLRALKFVDRNTKKDFARVVYRKIMSEEE
jgi:hypothetical protein